MPIKQQIQREIQRSQSQAGYGVSLVPYHTHDGSNSPRLSLTYILPITLIGTSPATTTNYSVFFTAPTTMSFLGATEIHTVKGTGGACTVNIEKLTGTTAPGAGTAILSTAFDLTATVNTLQTGVLTTAATTKQLVKGDRLALLLTGTPTSVANVQILITLAM